MIDKEFVSSSDRGIGDEFSSQIKSGAFWACLVKRRASEFAVLSFTKRLIMVFGISPLSILFCTFGTIKGNAKKKMSNPQYYTVYLIWMIICIVFEYLPSEDIVGAQIAIHA